MPLARALFERDLGFFMFSRPEIQSSAGSSKLTTFRHPSGGTRHRISPRGGDEKSKSGRLKAGCSRPAGIFHPRAHRTAYLLRRNLFPHERCRFVARKKSSKRTLERLVGAAILIIYDFAVRLLKRAKQGFFSGIDTSEKPSRRQIKGFVGIILDSLLLCRLMKRLGGSADSAQGSGPSVFHRESKA